MTAEEAQDLEYKIGGLPDDINTLVRSSTYTLCSFIVYYNENALSFYASTEDAHYIVAYSFGLLDFDDIANSRLQPKSGVILGGGYIEIKWYLKNDVDANKLVLHGQSGLYGAIPKDAAQKFAELILPSLIDAGLNCDGIEIQTEGKSDTWHKYLNK